jgi:hypothetical protein
MTPRTPKTIVSPSPQPGTGILHPFPTSELPHIDPFVFLDTGAPRNLGDTGIPSATIEPLSPEAFSGWWRERERSTKRS